MLNFNTFLIEAATEDKLTHLEHAEDHHINAGHEGFAHAVNTLTQVHKALKGEKSTASISTKYDGSPSIVFGHHPETGRFFVASKSAFNKNPKLNYTHKDIEENHGHAPGLVSKLSHALTHLPKVTPKHGVYQGDLMYAKHDNDVTEDNTSYHFKPNTITYSAKKNSPEGHKIKNAKIGIVVHTAYQGKTLENMKAKYNANTSNFGEHRDVHLISAKFDPSTATHSPEAQANFNKHIAAATKANGKIKDYSHLAGHIEHTKAYINSTIKDGTKPSVSGYRGYVANKLKGEIDKVKTEKAKSTKREAMQNTLSHIDTHAAAFNHTFAVHHHLQQAKNALVHTLSGAKYDFAHSINGRPTKPEGHVAVINNRPTKLVDRQEFSRENFLARKP